jgi:hypothetical protein
VSNSGGKARRECILDLVQPPFVETEQNETFDEGGTKRQYQLSVESTSDADTDTTGTGVQVITVTYNRVSGGPTTEDIHLDGKTPVLSSGTTITKVTDVVWKTVGTFGTSRGVIILRSIPVASPVNAPYPTVGSSRIVGSLLEGMFNNIPYNAAGTNPFGRPFVNLLLTPLMRQVGALLLHNPVVT